MWSLLIKLLLLHFAIALQIAPPYGPSQFSNIGMINAVGDDYICGIIYITQSSARFIQGFINAIDLATGEFWVAGSSATPSSGIRARLNDPSGRFGLEYWDNPLWTIAAESPSVTAGTGYPLCIPRYANGTDDPLCPMKNTVINGDTPTFIQFKPASSRSDTDPDPNIMAPLIVGDYVTVNGTEVEGGLLAVYSLVANLGLYTAPSELPSYIRVEEARIGVPGPAHAELRETRAVTYTTDPATPMQFYAIDVDPCTCVETTRNLQLAQPFSNSAGDVWGKGLFRLGKLNTVPITKSVGFTQLTGTTVTANGLVAGVFIQPVMLYIMPELLVFGDEMFEFNFNQFEHLSLGSGPLIEAKPGPEIEAKFPIVGQLDSWPGATAPGTTTCVIPTPTTIVTATETATETGTTLITSISSSATSTPVPSRDTVTILSADEEKGKASQYIPSLP